MKRLGKILTGVVAAATAVSVAVPAGAAPVLRTQPGTARPAPAPEYRPAARPAPAPAPQAVPQPIIQYVPGAPQAVSQPIVVKKMVENKIVYETSPGVALLTPAGAGVLNPQHVLATFEASIRPEDRATMNATRGVAGAGAALGGIAGGAVGAVTLGAAGAGVGAGGGYAVCQVITAAGVAVPAIAPAIFGASQACGASAAGVGGIAGAAAGAGAGFVPGAVAGALGGARAGANAVPGGAAVMDRAIADTTWELESQARVANGWEALAGDRPGDSMPGAGGNNAVPPAPAVPAGSSDPVGQINAEITRVQNDVIAQVNNLSSQVQAAVGAGVQLPPVPAPAVPTINDVAAAAGL